MRSEEELNRAMELYADTVRRVCFVHLKNYHDTEDIFQTVFMKYILYSGVFESCEHEKAWFIRVSINACRDLLRMLVRRKRLPGEIIEEAAVNDDKKEILQAVLSLPAKYREVIYLHYYEGYTAAETGKILGKKENTVYTLLSRGREMLKGQLGGDGFGE